MARMNRRWKTLGLAGLTVLAVSSPAGFARTDHFKCYQAQEVFVEWPRPAVLSDSFGGDSILKVHNAAWFCVPASQTAGEGSTIQITEPANHLTLYPLSNTSSMGRREIRIRNEFGTQSIGVTVARIVAVPTRKQGEPAPDGISPFKCYVATGTALDVPATLADEVQTQTVRILQPKYFCNPATFSFGGETLPSEASEASLTCYTITPGSQCPVRTIDFDNVIGAEDTLRMGPSTFACVPSVVLTDGDGLDAGGSPAVELKSKPLGRN